MKNDAGFKRVGQLKKNQIVRKPAAESADESSE